MTEIKEDIIKMYRYNPATVFYRLKNCVSSIDRKLLNVRNIVKIDKRIRLICINDREYKHELVIDYYEPHKVNTFVPLFGSNGGVSMIDSVSDTKILVYRYMTLDEINNEITNIKDLQRRISDYDMIKWKEENSKLEKYIEEDRFSKKT